MLAYATTPEMKELLISRGGQEVIASPPDPVEKDSEPRGGVHVVGCHRCLVWPGTWM